MCVVAESFEEACNIAPERVAVLDGDLAVTYGELRHKVDVLCTDLKSAGFAAGCVLPMLPTRCLDYVVVLLACSRLGIVYVPIDPVNPRDRVGAMLSQLGCRHLLTLGPVDDIPEDPLVSRLMIVQGKLRRVGPDLVHVTGADLADDLAIMFTSGTTGVPKGVRISHRGVVNLVDAVRTYIPQGCGRYLHHSSVGFDAALFEMWLPLLTGGCVTLNSAPFNVDIMSEMVERSGCDVLLLTTSLFHLVAMHRPTILENVRVLFVGGETLKPEHAGKILSLYPTIVLINGCGPTENTVFSTLHRVCPEDLVSGEPIPIGRPLRNVTTKVVAPNFTEVRDGEVGELLLGGDNLALGYIDGGQTEKSFLQLETGRYYRTGDHVQQDAKGVFHYRGRIDEQVKIKGYRVETVEIEHALGGYPGIAQCVVLATPMNAIEMRLICFLILENEKLAPSVDDINEFLRDRLPHYMVPSQAIAVPELPITKNGKLDKAKLLSLVFDKSAINRKPSRELDADTLVISVLQEILGATDLKLDDSLYTLGGSSLSVAMAHAALDRALDVTSPFDQVVTLDKVSQWVAFYKAYQTA